MLIIMPLVSHFYYYVAAKVNLCDDVTVLQCLSKHKCQH